MSFNQVCCSLWKARLNLFTNMKSSMRLPEDIEKINKFTSYQLPNKFKIVGLTLFIISVLAIISSVKLNFIELRSQELFERVAQTGVILGLLMITLSKEKVEDELIAKIRMQSFNCAVVGAVLLYLLLPFIHYLLVFNLSEVRPIE